MISDKKKSDQEGETESETDKAKDGRLEGSTSATRTIHV